MRLVLAVLLILTSPLALAIEVQGEGSSLEEALNNAFKVAIDQEVGVILDTERHLKNGEIVHNQILSYSAGYITTYEIVHHIHIRDRNIHQVTVDVTVASSKLKNFLLSSNHNPQFFNVDDIKAQIRLYKEGQLDGDKLIENTLKYFPEEAFNVQMSNFSIVGSFHNPREFFLEIPYTITWDEKYLVALQELLRLFELDITLHTFVKVGDEVFFISDQILMRKIKQVFNRRDFVVLNINSLQNGKVLNTCVQSIREKPGEPWGSVKSLYTHSGRGIDIKSNNIVDSFVLLPINENELKELQGTSEMTLTVSKNCPQNS